MADLKLAFGLRAIPGSVTCAWGARWIWPDDLVWDRQDMTGDDSDRKALSDWLNEGHPERPTPIGIAKQEARVLAASGELRSDEDRMVVLYEDDRGIVKANPQSSYGYLYVAAWLK